MHSDRPSATDTSVDVQDGVDEAALAAVMRDVPLGAGLLAGVAVALLVLGYFHIAGWIDAHRQRGEDALMAQPTVPRGMNTSA